MLRRFHGAQGGCFGVLRALRPEILDAWILESEEPPEKLGVESLRLDHLVTHQENLDFNGVLLCCLA